MFGGEFRTTNPLNCYGVGQIAQFEPGEVLIWSLATNATWLSIEPFTGVLSGTPTNSDLGWFWVNVTVDDGNNGTDWHNFTLIVWGIPNITIEKTSDLTTAEPGDIINYTIYYNNTGSGKASTLWINDTLPVGVTFVTSGAEANRTGDYNWIFYNVGVDEHNFTISVLVNGSVPNGSILRNYVHLEYIDSIGNPKPDSWDTVDVTILNGMSENQSPTILNCPSINIQYDLPYTFDYSPYIQDPDTLLTELVLTTSDPDHTSINGLEVTYLYPQSMAGETVLIILTISDGTNTSNTTVSIIISSNWPPELIANLPDITLEENSTLYDVFDLDDYFFDMDNDSLYFSYGNFNILVDIKSNNSVDITAKGNWTGTELVTFRARDSKGAIAEDIITVTVIPDSAGHLEISSITLSNNSPSEGEEITITVEIQNTDNNSNEITVIFYDGDPSQGGEQIGAPHVITIGSDSSHSLTQTWVVTMGNHTLYVVVGHNETTETITSSISVEVTEELVPELVLSVGDINMYRFEPGFIWKS
jgi:uncharacterized repeat protein (TIGR01451 family)